MDKKADAEACALWMDQRIEEEQANGLEHAEIGRIVAQEVLKVFEARVAARTIEQRSRRLAATNVAESSTPSSSKKKQGKQHHITTEERPKCECRMMTGPKATSSVATSKCHNFIEIKEG